MIQNSYFDSEIEIVWARFVLFVCLLFLSCFFFSSENYFSFFEMLIFVPTQFCSILIEFVVILMVLCHCTSTQLFSLSFFFVYFSSELLDQFLLCPACRCMCEFCIVHVSEFFLFFFVNFFLNYMLQNHKPINVCRPRYLTK